MKTEHSENCGQCIPILDTNFQTRKQYRCMKWNIREIRDGKLHLNNIKREDCLNLKKSWKPLIQKGDKEYTSTLFSTATLFSTVCTGPEKGLPDPSPIGPRWLPLPLPWPWSTNLHCFPWSYSFNFSEQCLFFYYHLTLLMKHYGCKEVPTSNQ